LIKGGADINALAFESAGTLLATAARHGHLDLVNALLQHGAGPNKSDGYWATPLARATKSGHQKVLDTLIRHGPG